MRQIARKHSTQAHVHSACKVPKNALIIIFCCVRVRRSIGHAYRHARACAQTSADQALYDDLIWMAGAFE